MGVYTCMFFYAKYSANSFRASALRVGGGKLPPPAPTPPSGPDQSSNPSYATEYTVKTFGLLQPYFGHLSCMSVVYVHMLQNFKGCSLVPRLSPRANEKSKERGEPGRIYHVRNVIGKENLITCGRTNELTHTVRTECSCNSLWATEWD